MKSTVKKLPGSQVELEVSLEQKDFQPYWDQVYQEALSSVQLKGFRPGTAPKEMAEQAVDKEKVFDQAANQAVHFSLNDTTKGNEWILVDQPYVEVLPSDSGLKYKATLTIFPE